MKQNYREQCHAGPKSSVHQAMFIAASIAKSFTERAPTLSDMQEKFSMSRATAYRWLRAWKDANGLT